MGVGSGDAGDKRTSSASTTGHGGGVRESMRVDGTVLGRHVVIETGAIVEAAEIGEASVVEAGAVLGRGCVVGKVCSSNKLSFPSSSSSQIPHNTHTISWGGGGETRKPNREGLTINVFAMCVFCLRLVLYHLRALQRPAVRTSPRFHSRLLRLTEENRYNAASEAAGAGHEGGPAREAVGHV